MDCDFLMKSYLHFNAKGMKLWMTDLLSQVKLYHYSITKAAFVASQPMFPAGTFGLLWRASWPPLPWKSYFPLGATHPRPSATAHSDAGDTRGQPGFRLADHKFRAFHGLRCLTWPSHNNADGLSHPRGQSAFVRRPLYHILRVKSHSGHWHFLCMYE